MRGFILTLALVSVSPALACTNDRSVEVDEEEFRSTYGERESVESGEPSPVTAGVAGGGLLGLVLLGTAFHAARRLDA